MTTSRLTASLARGRVGSISPSTFIHVLRLVQREYVPERRALSTIKGKESALRSRGLGLGSSLERGCRAVCPPISGRRHASSSEEAPTEPPDAQDPRQRPGAQDDFAQGAGTSSAVFRFWSEDDPIPEEKPTKKQKQKRKQQEHSYVSRATGERITKASTASGPARARSIYGIPDDLGPQPTAAQRDLPSHVLSQDDEDMHIRMPTDRRRQMTRLDGSMEYDRYLKRYTGLDPDAPPRIVNQGAPTNDPNYLTRDPNWYRYGYQLGRNRKVPKPENDLDYLDNLVDLGDGQRQKLRDIKRILKPKRDVKRFGFSKWSTDPLSSRFFRRRIGTPPSPSGHPQEIVIKGSSPPPRQLHRPRNRYSPRRRRSPLPRTRRHFTLSTIYPRLPSRTRRKRVRVRLGSRVSAGPPSRESQFGSASPSAKQAQSLPRPRFLETSSQTPNFARLQRQVASRASRLLAARSTSKSPVRGSLAQRSSILSRPTPSPSDTLPIAPLFPDPSTSFALEQRSLESQDFIGLELQPTDCVRLLATSDRMMEATESDLAAIEAISEFLANPITSLDNCGGLNCAHVPGILPLGQLKAELLSPTESGASEIIAIIVSLPKESIWIASTNSIRHFVHEFQRSARPSEWLWLAQELVNMLHAVTRASYNQFEPSLVSVTYAAIALAVARAAHSFSGENAATLRRLSEAAIDLSAVVRRTATTPRPPLESAAPETGGATTASNSDLQTNRRSFALANELSLLSVASAHLGHWEEARERMTLAVSLSLARTDQYPKYDLRLLIEYYELLANTGHLDDLVQVMTSVGDDLRQALLLERDSLRRNVVFCRIFYNALADIQHPVDWLDKTFGWTKGSHDSARVMYTALTRFTSRTNDALELAERLYTHKVYISLDASARLCGSLFRLGRHEDAQTLYGITRARNSRSSHAFLSTMLNHFTDAGLFEDATEVYNEIVAVYGTYVHDQMVIPTKLADLGRPDDTIDALRTNFGPSWADDERLLLLLLRAHQQGDDIRGVERLYQRLLRLGPNVAIYNSMIDFYAKQGETSRALDVFRVLLESGVSPDVTTFERLIRMFTDRRDLSNVSLLLDAMTSSGIEPSDQNSSSVIQAHVDSGDWLGAAKCWRTLPLAMQNAPGVAGAILRAFVMLGTPPNIIFSMFQGIERPTASQWSFLLLSYCDAGQMEAAANVFDTMDRRSRTITKAPPPTLYTFSILMYGYLRNNNPDLGRATFQEMLRRHVIPSGVTYASIVQSYLNSGDITKRGLDRLHRFAMSVHAIAEAGGMTLTSRGQSDVRDVFASMVTAAGNTGEIETAQAYFDVSVSKANQPKSRDVKSIGRLMDAYRKAGDIDNVMKMWRRAFDAALALRGDANSALGPLPSSSGVDVHNSIPSNLLCVSLSIVMSAIGDAGNYSFLREVWNQVRMEGFGFSPQNFIDYSVALVKCGDVEGAFYVISKVLEPRDRLLQQQRRATIEKMQDLGSLPDAQTVQDTDVSSGERPTFTPAQNIGTTSPPQGEVRDDAAETATVDERATAIHPSEELDDTEELTLTYNKNLPLPQRMSSALYSSDLVEGEASYDPKLFGSAKEFAKERPPSIASTVTNLRQPLAHASPRNSTQRSRLMVDQQARMETVPQPAQGVHDLTSHLLTHLRPEDTSWRPTQLLWETISNAYGELQGQRKELSEQVTAARLGLISSNVDQPFDTLDLSTEKHLDEIDPRRQPRQMVLTQFNGVFIRDRHGRPMKSTPVVVLWRLNAIYPDVVRGIYKFRQFRSGQKLQERVAHATRTSPRQGSPEQEQERIRRRDRLLDKVEINPALLRDRNRYGMTKDQTTSRNGGEAGTVKSMSVHDQRTAEAIAVLMEHRKKKSEKSNGAIVLSPRRTPEYDSLLRRGRRRAPAKVKILRPKVNLNRLGIRQSELKPDAVNLYARLVEQHQRGSARANQALEDRAIEAKRILKDTDYGELMEEFRVRKRQLQERYQRAEAEAEEHKQRANG